MKAAHFSIPREFRPRYIPCLDEECQVLLDQLEETGDTEVADHLIESLDVDVADNSFEVGIEKRLRDCYPYVTVLLKTQH